MTSVLVVTAPEVDGPDSRYPSAHSVSTGTATGLAAALESVDASITVLARQTDDEAELISWLHGAADEGWGVVIDPAAFTSYSYGLRDAAALVVDAGLPVIEVHLTNPASLGEARQSSVIAAVSTGIIAGFGLDSYRFAVAAAGARVAERQRGRLEQAQL
ncbi:type II 3-dehydroquinate dehydratase [Frondihabitans sp. VKM Ac-2883]|uniref:type II 3-dehydroquinate dehydratase n=1 Tax=Frondihabitans sp. VKM Ac-2883 TaxID=2783823 RepID=UPI00188D823A|nr:type II 3-dehydroquinate dehydratase [Frondihabitans sp. VKM Ac-2883]